jgi:hypothetical protein
MKKLVALNLVLGLALLLAGTVGAQSTEFEVVRVAVDDWMGSGAPVVVTAEALFENLHDGDESNDPFLLDIRSPEDYAAAHLEGAVNIPFKTVFEVDNLAQLPTDQQIVVVCYTGHTTLPV